MVMKDFEKWTPNIKVSVWGKGKATANKRDCPIPIGSTPPGANYHGDCQDCDNFMGAKFTKTPEWGDWVPACCWAKIDKPATPKEPA